MYLRGRLFTLNFQAFFMFEKAGTNKRKLFDGREFEIYKRFFEKTDLAEMAVKFNLNLQIVYWGNLFFTAVEQFNNA